MRTFPLFDTNGEIFAFEIESSYFPTSGSIARFFRKCPSVEVTRVRKFLEFGNEVWAEFLMNGIEFEVWEPFGDNGRFWVGPKGEEPSRVVEVDELMEFVHNNWPGVISKTRARILGLFGIQT